LSFHPSIGQILNACIANKHGPDNLKLPGHD